MGTNYIIEDLTVKSDTDLRKTNKKFKQRKDIEVVIEVDESASKHGTSWEEEEMSDSEATRYRAIAARLNFLAIDRPDLMFAAKECSRKMARPQNGDWAALK